MPIVDTSIGSKPKLAGVTTGINVMSRKCRDLDDKKYKNTSETLSSSAKLDIGIGAEVGALLIFVKLEALHCPRLSY